MSKLSVEDRLDIQELMARYSRCIDFNDWETLPALFTDDCVLDFGKVMGTHEGKDAVRNFANMLKGAGLTMRHYVTNCIITGDGNAADATTYVLAFTGQPGSLSSTTGRYEDTLRKIDGKWLLQRRKGIIELGR